MSEIQAQIKFAFRMVQMAATYFASRGSIPAGEYPSLKIVKLKAIEWQKS